MFIQTESTPNPDTVKFLPGQSVMPAGTAEFDSAQSAAVSPLARRLFAIDGVVRVFLSSDFVSVSRSAEWDWRILKPAILAAMLEHFSSGQPAVEGAAMPQDAAVDRGPQDEITLQIRELLDTRVRPAVAADGGDITFHSFEKGILYLRLQGACAGCPSSTATLKTGIENMMRHYIPEVLEVRAVPDY